MSKIKIVTGWSAEGGSTFSLMELCDLFNEKGHECYMYGPHEWHLDKCKGAQPLPALSLERDDIIIGHFLPLPERPPVKKIVLSCHEKEVFKLKEQPIKGYDDIRLVSDDQKAWQGVKGTVIPNLIRGVNDSGNHPDGVAGVIGTLCPLKQTHVSVERALDDGYKKVLIYGNVLNRNYFNKEIQPLLDKHSNVHYMGMELDKQKLYNSISCVYQSNSSALPEAFGRVRAECIRAGIPYHGNDSATIEFELWDEDRVYEAWKELLEL